VCDLRADPGVGEFSSERGGVDRLVGSTRGSEKVAGLSCSRARTRGLVDASGQLFDELDDWRRFAVKPIAKRLDSSFGAVHRVLLTEGVKMQRAREPQIVSLHVKQRLRSS